MTKIEYDYTPEKAFEVELSRLTEGDFFVLGTDLFRVGAEFSSFLDSYTAILNMSTGRSYRQRKMDTVVIAPTDLVIRPVRM